MFRPTIVLLLTTEEARYLLMGSYLEDPEGSDTDAMLAARDKLRAAIVEQESVHHR